jgi:hypothetical protein
VFVDGLAHKLGGRGSQFCTIGESLLFSHTLWLLMRAEIRAICETHVQADAADVMPLPADMIHVL